MRRRWVRLLAMFTVVALAAPTLAQPRLRPGFGPPHHREGGPERGFDRMLERHAERLEIDAETQDRIREISDAARVARKSQHEALRSLHDALRKTLEEDAPDEAQVMKLADEIGAIEIEKRKSRLRTMLQIRALLTPEQRAELVEIHAERMSERRKHRPFPRHDEGAQDLDEAPVPR